ncbi:tol-pal system protein YbgF [bacterium]|nr:tol-pal system protein YbgF [bacterium]
MNRISAFSLLLLLLIVVASPLTVQANEVKTMYDRAYALYEQGQLSSAIPTFREITEKYPNSSLADNAQYWIGEAYFVLKRYEQAIIEFDKTLTYKNTNKREDALYKLASCHERLGKSETALELYTRLLAEFPNTRHASYVLKKLDMLGS